MKPSIYGVVLVSAMLMLIAQARLRAQEQVSPVRGWEKVWEFALPDDAISAALIDLGGEEGLRLSTLHTDRSKEDALQVRFWKRAGNSWQTEWQSALDTGELRGMIAGAFVKGSKTPQVLSPRNLIHHTGRGYEKRVRSQEVNWLGYASLPDGTDLPIAAFPGGIWKGIISLDSRDEWLRFERIRADDLLSLPQQLSDADWVVLTIPIAFADLGGEEWTRQGFERLFAQVGRRLHPDQPFIVSRRTGEGTQALALAVPPTLNSLLRVIWQSDPIEGNIREVRLVSAAKLRGGLLVLVGRSTGLRVQFWQVTRQGSEP